MFVTVCQRQLVCSPETPRHAARFANPWTHGESGSGAALRKVISDPAAGTQLISHTC